MGRGCSSSRFELTPRPHTPLPGTPLLPLCRAPPAGYGYPSRVLRPGAALRRGYLESVRPAALPCESARHRRAAPARAVGTRRLSSSSRLTVFFFSINPGAIANGTPPRPSGMVGSSITSFIRAVLRRASRRAAQRSAQTTNQIRRRPWRHPLSERQPRKGHSLAGKDYGQHRQQQSWRSVSPPA